MLEWQERGTLLFCSKHGEVKSMNNMCPDCVDPESDITVPTAGNIPNPKTGKQTITFGTGIHVCGDITDGIDVSINEKAGFVLDFVDLEKVYFKAKENRVRHWKTPGVVFANTLSTCLSEVRAIFESKKGTHFLITVILDEEAEWARRIISNAKADAEQNRPDITFDFDITGPVLGRNDDLLIEDLKKTATLLYLRSY